MSVHIATCSVAIEDPAGGYRVCVEPQVAVADVPLAEETVELALCHEHLRQLHESNDPISCAQGWIQ